MDGLIAWLTAISWWKKKLNNYNSYYCSSDLNGSDLWKVDLKHVSIWFGPLDTSCFYLMFFFFNLFLGFEWKINGFSNHIYMSKETPLKRVDASFFYVSFCLSFLLEWFRSLRANPRWIGFVFDDSVDALVVSIFFPLSGLGLVGLNWF